MAEPQNVYGTLVPDELSEGNVEANDLRIQLVFCTYATAQQVLLRVSAPKKIAFLCRLFIHVKRHKYIKMIQELLLKYARGKLPNYLNTLDSSEFINDERLTDNDRSMDSDELEKFFNETARWFRNLDNPDLQLGIFLSFLSICGNNVTREVLIRTRKSKGCDDTLDAENTSWTALPQNDHIIDMDWNEPDAQELLKKRKDWKDAITKYRSKVERSFYGVDVIKKSELLAEPKKNDKKTSQGEVNDDKKTKGGSKKNKRKKEEKTAGKKGKKGKSEIDFIQLMPIWISINIFKYLDAKTLNVIKGVNKYWEFVVSCVGQEEKARKKINSWIASIQEEYNIKDIIPNKVDSIKPEFRFNRVCGKRISCAAKVHDEIRELIDAKEARMNESVVGAVANNPEITLRLPANNLQPLTRLVPGVDHFDVNATNRYIHPKMPHIYYDKVMIDSNPIANLKFMSEALDAPDVTGSTNSFEYWPTLLEKYPTLKMEKSKRFRSRYESRKISLYKSAEFEQLLATLVKKSIATFRGASQKVTFLGEAEDSANSPTTSRAISNTKKSIELEMIKANIRRNMNLQDSQEDDTPIWVYSHPMIRASYADYLVEDDLLDEECDDRLPF